MIRQLIRARRRQVLLDISTQRDFFLAAGNACINNHRRVLANVRRIMAWARSRKILVISTCEVYPDNNGDGVINYCIDGTDGQKKIRYTLLQHRISFPADGRGDLPQDVLRRYRQIVLHKRCPDPFDEPRIDRLLSEVRANEFVLIGANAEDSVKSAALGLLQRGKKVSVVVDAVGSRNKREGKLAIRKMGAKGARLIETRKLAGSSHLKGVGICHCRSCSGSAGQAKKVAVRIAAQW